MCSVFFFNVYLPKPFFPIEKLYSPQYKHTYLAGETNNNVIYIPVSKDWCKEKWWDQQTELLLNISRQSFNQYPQGIDMSH